MDGRGGGEGGESTRKANSSLPMMWEGTGDGQSREEHLQGALPWALHSSLASPSLVFHSELAK